MIKNIIVTNDSNQSVTIDLMNPEKSGFIIKSIEGLGPVKADVNLREMSNLDGAFFNSVRADKRNIIFNIIFFNNFSFDQTIEDLRQLSYKYFPLKKNVKIEIETDKHTFQTYGYIESNEPNIFSNEEDTIISILCPKSYFTDTLPEIKSFSSIVPAFSFPFSNNNYTQPLLKMGDINLETLIGIYNKGDVETGVLIKIHFVGAATDIEIINNKTNGSIFIDTTKLEAITGSAIGSGDDIFISTVKGNKYAIILQNGNIYNILNSIIDGIEWFELEPGDNNFTYLAETGIENIQFSFIFDILYQGV